MLLTHRLAPGSALLYFALAFAALGGVLGASAGCGGGDGASADAQAADYCDAVTPCTDPERKYCDLSGQYPASNGKPNTCIPDPALTEQCSATQACPEGDTPHCTNGGMCVACLNFSHCNAESPVCSLTTHTCTGCRSGEEGDAICNAIDPLQPYCSEPGSCVECLNNAHCDIVSAPICDAALLECRACTAGECESGTCNETTGVCEPAN